MAETPKEAPPPTEKRRLDELENKDDPETPPPGIERPGEREVKKEINPNTE